MDEQPDPVMDAAWREIPGPADRETFMAAQHRQRRASWRLSALCGFVVFVLGIPLSALLSPLLLIVALLAYDVVGLTTHLSSPFGTLPTRMQHDGAGAVVTSLAKTPALALLLVPGAVFLVLCWLGVRRVFRGLGAGADLVARSRPPRTEELAERRLVNLVEAVSIAAGLAPPTVRLIDSDAANAGIAGHTHEDATIVVTTGLLAQLDRYETEGVVAHCIAAIGAGDLNRARTLESFYATLGLIEAALGFRAVPGAGRALRLTLRGRDHVAAQSALIEILSAGRVEAKNGCLSAVLTPLTVTAAAFTFNQQAVGDTVMRSLLHGRWRHRVLLADATSVELTRYPDGIAKALRDLSDAEATLDVSEVSSELLVVGNADGKSHPPVTRRVAQLARIGATVTVASSKASRRTSRIVWVLLSPLFALIGALMVALIAASVGASMVIVVIYFSVPLVLLHALLVSAGR